MCGPPQQALAMCGPPQQALVPDDDDLPALVSADAPEFIFVLEKQARGAMHVHFLLFLPRSPRRFHELYLDAMAIVRVHGAPDLFTTITLNPKGNNVG